MFPFNEQLKLYDGKDNARIQDATDALHISNARLEDPFYINSAITYLAGNAGGYKSQNFPILLELQGKGRKKGITSTDNTYRIRMYGKPKTTTTVVRTSPGSNHGTGGSKFKMYFADQLFMKNQEIHSGGLSNPVVLRVYDDGRMISKNVYEYTVGVQGDVKQVGISANAIRVNSIWGGGVAKVGLKNSHGTKHRSWQTPFEMKNQLTVIRDSYTVAGNVENKRLAMPIRTQDGKTITLWTDWEYYNHELEFAVKRNEDLIFSKYNADTEGRIYDFDADTGDVVPSGMGLWDMITNKVEYSKLTVNKVDRAIQDLFNNIEKAVNLEGDFIIAGGLGFLRDFDEALSKTARGFVDIMSENHFITKGENGLRYGNYFTEYKHYSGKIIKVVYDQAFDKSARAKTSGIHPISGLPTMSHCGIALDFSEITTGSGTNVPNIYMTYEEGREYIEKFVPGMAALRNMPSSQIAATDIDRSSRHKMASQGVYLNNPLTCTKFICNVND